MDGTESHKAVTCHDCPHRDMLALGQACDIFYTGATNEGGEVFEMPVSLHPCHNDVRLPCRGSAAVTKGREDGTLRYLGDQMKITASPLDGFSERQHGHLRFPLRLREHV